MSELLEKVRAIIETHIAACEPPDAIARATLAAVADWLDNSHKLDDDSKVSLALRAAAETKDE